MVIKNKQVLLTKKLLVVALLGIMFINMIHAEMSEEERKCRYDNNECYKDHRCYPVGFVKDGKYCIEESTIKNNRTGRVIHTIRNIFINQYETGTNCTYDFECKTNFCSQNKCVNQTETEIELKKLNKEMGLEIIELSNKIDKILEKLDFKLEEPNNTENTKFSLEVDKNKTFPFGNEMLKFILNWFRF